MVYKILYETEGIYLDKDNRPITILETNWADTPEGRNVGWETFENLEAFLTAKDIKINIEKQVLETETDNENENV